MQVYKTNYELASSDYLHNAEQILEELVRSEHRIVQAFLHGKPVYIITDMVLAKRIFEDGKNFSFTANPVTGGDALTEGTKAFVSEGLESPLLASSYDDYKETRRIFNQAFKYCVTDQAEPLSARAKMRITSLLNAIHSPTIDILALCRNYWMPLAADVIGLGALSIDKVHLLAECSRILVEANGLHGDSESIDTLAKANSIIIDLIREVIEAGNAPENSAMAYLLGEVDTQKTIDLTLAFILGGIDTGSTALALQAYLLAVDAKQRANFISISEEDQRTAITELASKSAPAYYTPRFAVRDVKIADVEIPAGSFLHLPLYGLNSCANPDFDVKRNGKSSCPAHHNETLPFGHARHRCPGESLARYLIPIFLNGLFSRYPSFSIQAYEREQKHFSRSVSKFIIQT